MITTWQQRLGCALLDLLAALIFATIGRASHAEHLDLAAICTTAWPFLVGVAVGWIVVLISRTQKRLTQGLIVWPVTVAAGMATRALAGGGVQVSFVIVALVALAVLMLGWRGIAALIARSHA